MTVTQLPAQSRQDSLETEIHIADALFGLLFLLNFETDCLLHERRNSGISRLRGSCQEPIMTKRKMRIALAMAIALWATASPAARAQWGYYPRGYGGCGWGGWGGGAETPQGSMARGMGAYAAGAGYYNQQTAVARSINTDTAMRYNQYMYESNLEANRLHQAKLAGDKADNLAAYDKTQAQAARQPHGSRRLHG